MASRAASLTRKQNSDSKSYCVVERAVPGWIVQWQADALDNLAALDGAAARRLLRLVSEFAESPNAVDFERVPESPYWYLYAPEVVGWAVLVSIEEGLVVHVLGVHFVGEGFRARH